MKRSSSVSPPIWPVSPPYQTTPAYRWRPKLARSRSILPLNTTSQFYVHPRTFVMVDDPFSLSDFFPSHLGIADRLVDPAWDWLRDRDAYDDEEPSLNNRSGFAPLTMKEEGSNSLALYMESDEGEAGSTVDLVGGEDERNPLSLNKVLTSMHDHRPFLDDRLLSPYLKKAL
ncbi:hypothetical protein AcW1_000834 [Taiwanofungus camphoratus]|nr:hypothetical protein AcW2_000663 [Antrodia cinnamomea]KAI0936650.1 hypothetical protein AcV5_004735 [Antrodia cinnamomea]KAI0961868.1 hypothetical protein AcV7_000853 [Antrodia cinnamomea]KAI0963877.1 hypothetical protein AcW1_000834 [Antrodia cinnamomea]